MARERISERRHVVIDFYKFNSDVEKKQREMKKEDGISYGDRLENNGLPPTLVANSKWAAIRNNETTSEIKLSEYEDCIQYGIIQKICFEKVCNIYNLDGNDYVCKKKSIIESNNIGQVNDINDVNKGSNINEIISKIDELIIAINKLGNIEMQNMEYLKSISDANKNTSKT